MPALLSTPPAAVRMPSAIAARAAAGCVAGMSVDRPTIEIASA